MNEQRANLALVWYLQEEKRISKKYAPDIRIGIIFNALGLTAIALSLIFQNTNYPLITIAAGLELIAFSRFAWTMKTRYSEILQANIEARTKAGLPLPPNAEEIF